MPKSLIGKRLSPVLPDKRLCLSVGGARSLLQRMTFAKPVVLADHGPGENGMKRTSNWMASEAIAQTLAVTAMLVIAAFVFYWR